MNDRWDGLGGDNVVSKKELRDNRARWVAVIVVVGILCLLVGIRLGADKLVP